MFNPLEYAIKLAVSAHYGQTRKNGTPYILHPMRVMLKLAEQGATEEELIVAILHDVLEDTEVTYEELESDFEDSVVQGVWNLTKKSGESYWDYLEIVKLNPIARKVKIADLQDNSNIHEIPEIQDYDLRRLKKYHKAMQYLKDV